MAGYEYGMDSDLKRKQDAKFDAGLESKVCGWITAVTGEGKSGSTHEWLKTGVTLCNLANRIKPGVIKSINSQNAPFKHMENITRFMDACRDFGVPESSLFGCPDLYEDKNMGSVCTCIKMLAGVVQVSVPGFGGPHLGQPMAVEAKDAKREKQMANQTAGFKGAMETLDADPFHKERARAASPGRAGSPGRSGGSVSSPRGSKSSPRGSSPRGKHTPGMVPREDVTYGLDADLKAKQEAKYDTGLEQQVTSWIQSVTGDSKGDQTVQEWLKDGKVLCKLANCIRPGIIPKVNTMNAPFKQMENITYFMNAARTLGVPEGSLFGTPDLYEDKNMGTVISALYCFGGAVQASCPGYSGAKLGTIAADSKDRKREGMVATQSGGYSTSLQVADPLQSAKGIVKPGFHGVTG